MTTMISNLPEDLIEQIFSRVPIKSMKAVRLTCKTWNTLSKSESFGKATREGREKMMIAIKSHKLNLISVVANNVDPSIEFKGQVSFISDKLRITQLVVDYEGLLLFTKGTTRIVVWNPYLGQTRWIKLRYPHRFWSMYALGYEDKKSCRSVKLLRFIDYFLREPQFFWYEIFDFDSGLWKTLDVTPHWRIYVSCCGVTLKGNTYWCAQERNSKPGYERHIICFDFTRERFGPLLSLPSSVKGKYYPYVNLFCVREEQLAALFQHDASYEEELEIWITTKIDFEMVSWSKFLRMDTGPKIGFQMSCCIDEEKKVFMGFERDMGFDEREMGFERDDTKIFINIIGEAGYLKKKDLLLPEDRYFYWPHVCSYVPSLVQIKKLHARVKRIKQSPLEKCRIDQNKSRLDATEELLKKSRMW